MGKAIPIERGSHPGTRKMTDGRLPADLLRSLQPSIEHYVPALLLKDALARAEAKAEYAAKKGLRTR